MQMHWTTFFPRKCRLNAENEETKHKLIDCADKITFKPLSDRINAIGHTIHVWLLIACLHRNWQTSGEKTVRAVYLLVCLFVGRCTINFTSSEWTGKNKLTSILFFFNRQPLSSLNSQPQYDRWYRRHKRSSLAMGIFVLVSMCNKSVSGCASLSASVWFAFAQLHWVDTPFISIEHKIEIKLQIQFVLSTNFLYNATDTLFLSLSVLNLRSHTQTLTAK